jgi:hypothetical protein
MQQRCERSEACPPHVIRGSDQWALVRRRSPGQDAQLDGTTWRPNERSNESEKNPRPRSTLQHEPESASSTSEERTQTNKQNRTGRVLGTNRARVTVVKSGSVTENRFHQRLVYFASCAHHKTRLIVTFLAFITFSGVHRHVTVPGIPRPWGLRAGVTARAWCTCLTSVLFICLSVRLHFK